MTMPPLGPPPGPPPGSPPPYGVNPVFAPPPPRRGQWSNGKLLTVVLGILIPAVCGAFFFVPRIAHSTLSPGPRPSIGGLDDWSPGEPPMQEPLLPEPETLSIGQCVTPMDGATADTDPSVVACSTPHQGEVFEIIPISGDTYPGEAALVNQVGGCQSRLSAYANMAKVTNMKV